MRAAIHAVGLGSIALIVLVVGGCAAVMAEVQRRGEWVRAGNDPAAYTREAAEARCRLTERPVRVELSRREYPDIIRHIRRSWRPASSASWRPAGSPRGWPRVLRVHREHDGTERSRLLSAYRAERADPKGDGLDLDEAPAAVLRASWRADVEPVDARQNRSAGAVLGNAIRGWCDGQRVVYRFVP